MTGVDTSCLIASSTPTGHAKFKFKNIIRVLDVVTFAIATDDSMTLAHVSAC